VQAAGGRAAFGGHPVVHELVFPVPLLADVAYAVPTQSRAFIHHISNMERHMSMFQACIVADHGIQVGH
jgi:hypothetical protein